MDQFNHPTQHLIHLLTTHLSSLGHTNIQVTERWERDGVYHVWTDQATKERDSRGVRYGWTLDVSGNDNELIDSAGISFSYIPKDSPEEYIIIESWDHLTEMINLH